MQIDPQFVDIGLALLLNILTQVGKKFHVKPFTVFTALAFTVSVVYGLVAFLGYQEAMASILASVVTIVGLAAGFWHIIMRPEGPLMQWWNNLKKK